MDRLKGKVAIITGAASGIGEGTAKLFSKEGAKVAIVDKDDVNGNRVKNEIQATGGEVSFFHADVRIEKEVSKAFSDIYNKYGKLNILVNDAGIAGSGKPSHELTSEEWYEVIDTNLKGPFFCVKYAVPYMIKAGGGSVVNISSTMGIIAGPTPAYNSSKGGLRLATKSDAMVYAKDHIRFNSIHPGYIITPLFKRITIELQKDIEQSIKDISTTVPLGRMGYPEDIANGILFLASDEAAYITGTELVIDGGNMIV